jgi:hypothetical protein
MFYLSNNGSTTAFSTDREPSVSGSGRPHNLGLGVQPTSNQKRIFSYRYSTPWNEYILELNGLTTTERDLLDTFVDALNGAAFYVKSINGNGCGLILTYTKVKFNVDGQKLPWAPQKGQKWGVILNLRDSI